MNIEWILTGIILLGAIVAGGIRLYLKRRIDTDNINHIRSDQE